MPDYPLITISVPTAPEPEYAALYRQRKGENVGIDTRPILGVEVVDATDGFGIVGEDMIPGRSITIRADRDYHARLRYLREGRPEYPLFVYTHPVPGVDEQGKGAYRVGTDGRNRARRRSERRQDHRPPRRMGGRLDHRGEGVRPWNNTNR